jgi:uncharacterized integral membrane protein
MVAKHVNRAKWVNLKNNNIIILIILLFIIQHDFLFRVSVK